ncbi:ribbon-helix-helix protein, CopG family [Stenotrophomonas indicatrix]|uniref:ribbon-helix-helix protein, CopG family n=1 Tax=Stenotrophomonas indicatrix TaxID=2045451 RepID=UPI000FDB9D5B|nr:ribbon-helix-helix protein, CopG family [Stenotrophomonas indicatrix]UID79493.1 ribbon-helix-helix protein, CopG family [Stenotrophomonas maltophilia]
MSSPTTFKFDEKLTATLEELKDGTNAASKAEVVRRAIALMKVVQDAQKRGAEVVIRDEDGKDKVIVLS